MSDSQLFGPMDLAGFAFERTLGSGGFADVFLYRQAMPTRRVAIKIMRGVVTEGPARAQFESEANLMARLSNHPSIVTIHEAGVATNGRPYLVMEYCSKANLADRYKQRPLSVPEMLRTIVRLCGAVETAHLAGILHRDIKPANVLTTDYGWPALTDFGISVIAGEATVGAGGVSLPWAPPEAVGGPGEVDIRSDVYALAATAYTILAGKSPFDAPTANPDMSGFIHRIMTAPVPPMFRADVPPELERLLALAMSKNPDDRPQTASSFARSLQRIEQDMSLPITHMDIPGGLLQELEAGDDDASLDDDIDSTSFAGSMGSARRLSADAEDPDERTELVAARTPRSAVPVFEEPDVDEGTVAVDRMPRQQADEPDEATELSQRGRDRLEDDSEERTVFVQRDIGDSDDPEDRTEIADRTVHSTRGARPSDRTEFRVPVRGVPTRTTAADLPVVTSRVAYIPGKIGSAPERYQPRTVESSPVIRRTPAPAPVVSRAREVAPAVAAQARSVRKSRKTLVIGIAVVAGFILLAALGALAIVLITAGVPQ